MTKKALFPKLSSQNCTEGKGNRKQFNEYELEAGKEENPEVTEVKVETKKTWIN